jgi:hypothetical protein
LSGVAVEMLAVVVWGVPSQILSARWEAESRLPSVWLASIACTCGGRRLKKIVRNVWCKALEVPEELRWLLVPQFHV